MSTALITGASAGLGLEFAKLFADDGVSLILTARSIDRLNQTASELRNMHPSIEVDTIAMDLARPGAAKELFNILSTKGNSIDFLVNNAGFGTSGSFTKLSIENELQIIDLNLRSLVELTHFILPGMLKKRQGRVLNVGSLAGFMPGPYMATYYASKAFLNSFSEALSVELKGTAVSCTLLTPGPTATNFANRAGVSDSKLFNLIKTGSPSEVARCGYLAMKKGKVVVIPGLINKLLVQSLRTAPRFIVRSVSCWLNKNK